MGQIQVYIPASGQTVAVPSRKAGLWSETMDWHVHCLNDSVKKVMIEFGTHHKHDDQLAMFKGKKREEGDADRDDHVIIKDVIDDGNGMETRTCNISGRVPAWTNDKTRRDKYTIVGLDANGDPIEETRLDPEIITTDPGGD